jgi:large conductance mechanosensitive channel
MPKILQGFKNFILRGNAVDLAVGVVIGAAFNTMIQAIVKGLLTPLIGAIAKVSDFSGLTFTINGSKFTYGDSINAFVSFFLISIVVYFFVIVPMNTLKSFRSKPSTTKKCPQCLSEIPANAKRCAYCTQIVA